MLRLDNKRLWFYLLAFTLLAGVLYFVWHSYGSGAASVLWIWGAVVCSAGLSTLANREKGSTTCPGCKADITRCGPHFCHVCGGRLEDQCCKTCHVDWRLSAALFEETDPWGNRQPITYCPACGFFANTLQTRHRG